MQLYNRSIDRFSQQDYCLPTNSARASEKKLCALSIKRQMLTILTIMLHNLS